MNTGSHPLELLILSTGGTFEKTYDTSTGELGFCKTGLSAWRSTCRLPSSVETECLMLIDSLDMDDSHRVALAQRIVQAKQDRIVLIHGTDTLVKSAAIINQHKRANQVVVLTGAMTPAACADSDALFNLGAAVASAQTCAPGVYVACSATVFPWDQTEKDTASATFVWKTTSQYKTD